MQKYYFQSNLAKTLEISRNSQTTLKQTSGDLRLFKTILFVNSVLLRKSPASCGKPPEDYFG